MPCFKPLIAYFVEDLSTGKKKAIFPKGAQESFKDGNLKLGKCEYSGNETIMLPCGRCTGCRIEKSRQWAVRCMHEASLHDENCFLTLTYNDDNLPKDGSLVKKHMQDFVKRLRKKYEDRKISIFYCGEYGDNFNRPHYHACVFNLDFSDKVRFKRVGQNWIYVSDELSKLWKYGYTAIGDLTFESAAYVARYCTKKVTGAKAEAHYAGRLPEFAQMSKRPAIGKVWFEKYGMHDVYAYDECISNGVGGKPPRYYDKLLEKIDAEKLQKVKDVRKLKAEKKMDDNSHRRLIVKEKCAQDRFKKLMRNYEKSGV